MPSRGNRTTHPITTPRTEVQILYANVIGGDTGDCTLSTSEAANGEILSMVRTGAGKYTATFRYLYPELKQAPVFSFVGTTDGLVAQCASIDITSAGTAAVEVYVGSTPTDLTTTDTMYLQWSVRNSGKNK